MIFLGSDHAGFLLKADIMQYFANKDMLFEDLGTFSEERTDAIKYARKVAEKVLKNKGSRGVLICGTGIAMSMAANRIRGIRGALCTSAEMARLGREHNDANVLILGGRITSTSDALMMLDIFLNTECLGERYSERNAMLDEQWSK